MSEVTLIGTTTLRRMLSAVYDETDPLHERNWYSECMCAHGDFEEDPSIGDDVVYLYYNHKKDTTIMTTVKGDLTGHWGSSAGFEGKVTL